MTASFPVAADKTNNSASKDDHPNHHNELGDAVNWLYDDRTPLGAGALWFTATPPTNWLICDGSSFSAVTYPALATLLGGTTLPDLRDVFPLGAGTKALGSTGGALGHTHTQPTHVHTVDPPATQTNASGQTASGIVGLLAFAAPAHTHSVDIAQFNSGSAGNDATGANDPPYRAVHFIIKAAHPS